MNKPKDLYLDEDAPMPRASAAFGFAPMSHGALGKPLDSATPEPLVSIDSPFMKIDEVEIMIIWLMKTHEWMENFSSDDKQNNYNWKKVN